MNLLLDTCVFSEFRKAEPDIKVIDWVRYQNEEALFLSVITIGEIQKGISLLNNSKRKAGLESWLGKLISRYDARILPLGTKELLKWGTINGKLAKKGRVLPFMDSLIAATALSNDLVLVTRNEADFKNTGVSVLNIWK